MATKVTSSLINTISASQITAVGATAGQVLTYNGSTSTWVASAAPNSANNFTVLLSSNGYQMLPSGLIMQWGKTASVGIDGTVNVAFPISFTSNIFSVVVSQSAAAIASGSSGAINLRNVVLSGFDIQNGADNVGPFFWQSIGY